jgi:hypothetical protein
MPPSPFIELAINTLATLVAAFAGSWYAFRLADRAASRESVSRQVAAINRGQFDLIQQINLLTNIQSQVIDPVRNHPGRFLAMRPLLVPVVSNPKGVDVDALSFLLETDDRELLFELLLARQQFDTAVHALNERSRLHLEIAQPRLAAAKIGEGTTYGSDEIEAALGREFFLHLTRATDDTISLIDRTRQSSEQLVGKFHSAMKRRYPKFSIIRTAPNSPEIIKATTSNSQ